MRLARVCIISLLCFFAIGAVLGQPPEVLEAARRAAAAAFPALRDAQPTASNLLRGVKTTALGCDLINGLSLGRAIDAHRLVFPLDGAGFALHVSADGALVQPCDARYPNLGSGVQPVERPGSDSDGDGLPDSADDCRHIAGMPNGERPGCPRISAADRDGDGMIDGHDRCPDQAGPFLTDGCALLQDSDGDGVPDRFDICADDFGIIQPDFARGCPADGSGRSTMRRGSVDLCLVSGLEIPVFESRAPAAALVARYDSRNLAAEAGAVSGRTAANDWYQLAAGWVKASDVRLLGACYNIPIVNASIGGATGCLMRPRQDFANVREAPNGAQVARIYATESQAVLGADYSGQWLFFRAGWVSRAALELAGSCELLPVLDPIQVASGVIHFCPPGYSGFLPPRISIGRMNARVASPTIANRLRAQPDVASAQVGEIPPRAIIDAILDGPACQGSHVWWQVQLDKLVGWTVESDLNFNFYYLEPIADADVSANAAANPSLRRPSAETQPAKLGAIHSANLAAVDAIHRLAVEDPRALAWSASRSLLAVSSDAGAIALFSYPEFRRMDSARSLPPTPSASAIAFSPDERFLAIGGEDGGLTVVEFAADASVPLELDALSGPVRALAWSQNGAALAAVSGDENLKLARRAGSLKVWNVDDDFRPLFHYSFPYPLDAVAFSVDSKWLALAGESTGDRRAGLWIYALETGDLARLKPLVFTGAGVLLTAPPTTDLGDFVYSSGDSLYQTSLLNPSDSRFFQQAGAQLKQLSFRPGFLPGAEALMALTSRDRSGATTVQLVNALNPDSRLTTLEFAPSTIAFSPDGRFLAATDRERDQVLILGVAAE